MYTHIADIYMYIHMHYIYVFLLNLETYAKKCFQCRLYHLFQI